MAKITYLTCDCGVPVSECNCPQKGHVLFETGDADVPDIICDRNGEVVLGLCKVCGKGEIELDQPCVRYQ